MPPPTITTRLARIEDIARSYSPNSGADRLDVATDLLADLQHWCGAKRIDFDHALRRARMHFDAEALEAGA